LRLTAEDLLRLKLIDATVEEPEGGAHMGHDETARQLDLVLSQRLAEAVSQPLQQRMRRRYERLRAYGQWGTAPVE
jgi:acetyl-CoA carboxylase carboxyl transferase subunit alpha